MSQLLVLSEPGRPIIFPRERRMSTARTSTLATLRGNIERIETPGDGHAQNRVALGHAGADAMLHGGLAVAAVHEVFSEGHQGAAATGFIAGLAGRVTPRRPLVGVVPGRAADAETALRATADALACDALGAVVLEVWGEARQLDLVASRKLTLTAQASGVTALLLRVAAEPAPSTAETRWMVRAAHSPPGPSASAWGAPVFDAQLVRNRHAPVVRWIMEWNCD